MSRNRMKNSQSLHWMGVLKWILILGLMSVLGLSYMLCKNRNLHAAQEVSDLQRKLAVIQSRNATLAGDLERMKSMSELRRRLMEMHSNLIVRGDPRAIWENMEQNTRMRLERIGTIPNQAVNFNPPVAQTDAPRGQH